MKFSPPIINASDALERHIEGNRQCSTFHLVDVEYARRQAEEIDRLHQALTPFALWADSMYTLKDDDKVAGIYVRHFRDALKIFNDRP
jgi:hypothetical protein